MALPPITPTAAAPVLPRTVGTLPLLLALRLCRRWCFVVGWAVVLLHLLLVAFWVVCPQARVVVLHRLLPLKLQHWWRRTASSELHSPGSCSSASGTSAHSGKYPSDTARHRSPRLPLQKKLINKIPVQCSGYTTTYHSPVCKQSNEGKGECRYLTLRNKII